MERTLELSADDLRAERPGSATEDVHFPEALARFVIEAHTAPGAVVLDPFAGYGTTLVVSEQLGRQPVGVELLADRVALIRQRVRPETRVIQGDARQLDDFGVGAVDLCLTSPPYMSAIEHPQNPLTAYSSLDGHYPTYLEELVKVFLAVDRCLRPGGVLVINAANIWTGGVVTPLAWDLTHGLQQHLTFCGETYLRWDRPPEFTSGDYCLTFRSTTS
ncbi:DNA methyltransferase [Nocardioides sp. HM23]|uniref:DNA methyltransferase n=1 Tax=Nocardioides bizhenqiangii TaxID=3095076 RepID=UPI002ACA152B|nr:DNA methyltransferase [Nocardioides sp. HM23]MDZ5620349.1 DNA methyltransferase [Nocardioides sp. HM23]